ncbi:MAG: histidine kinase dimerization/phospho-acceptor domain-containing protein [Bacteroidales bacterium]
MRVKYIVFFVFILFYPGCLFAEGNAERDSFLRELRLLPPDTTRLNKITDIACIKQSSEEFLDYALLLQQEAESQDNNKHICISIYYRIVYYYNRRNLKQVVYWLEKLKPLALQEKLYYEYFNSRRFLVILYSFNTDYELAINEAKIMREDARLLDNTDGIIAANLSLASAYIGVGRKKESMELLEEALSLNPASKPVVRQEILIPLVTVYYDLKKYQSCLDALKELEKVLVKFEEETPGSKGGYIDLYLFKELYYAFNYLKKGDVARIEEHVANASQYLHPGSFYIYDMLYSGMLSKYYAFHKQYEKALVENDILLRKAKPVSADFYMLALTDRANIMIEAGDARQAIALYQRILPMTDSVYNVLADRQMPHIQSVYEVEKAELEKAELLGIIRMSFLVFILFVLLIGIIFTVKLIQIRWALKQAKSEMKEVVEAVEKANELKTSFLKNVSDEIQSPLNSIVDFSNRLTNVTELPPHEKRKYSEIIADNSELLLCLINDILDLSRLEAGMMRFHLSEEDIVQLAQVAVDKVCGEMEDAHLLCFVSSVPSLIVHTDSLQMINLMTSLMKPVVADGQKKPVDFFLEADLHKKVVRMHFRGSALAYQSNSWGDLNMRNNINQLLMDQLDGGYEILTKNIDQPVIIVTYPIKK